MCLMEKRANVMILGDRVYIDDLNLTVKKINLLTTLFQSEYS
jgi:hypothetical protein